ncbi:hypothetical protein Dhaf_1449 [Desulfitobacterium hafniense DCB-2]|uniref:Uncharacterized protein n=1 Tax=Desulfitobacterium hafniense (strain DSM 10664 / DCB-2) TaxID=272564 RepID=B8FNX7_DESHD|nr:hypothetical protein [Desulfitobacterium hafniense]ACL19502.1 hypothetical protein Dhaf_1449 [Desulfitobacterium hafniense DCB-2]
MELLELLKAYIDKFKRKIPEKWLMHFEKNPLIPIGTVMSVIGVFFYTLGYLFLYGYYFGGEELSVDPSFLKILVKFVPFNHSSVTLVGFLYLITVLIISVWLVQLYFKWNQKPKMEFYIHLILGLCLLFTVSAFLSFSFIGRVSIKISSLWFGPFFIVLWLFSGAKTIKKPLVLFGATSNGLLLLLISALIFNLLKLQCAELLYNIMLIVIIGIFIPVFSIFLYGLKKIKDDFLYPICINPLIPVLIILILKKLDKCSGYELIILISSYIILFFPAFFILKIIRKKIDEKINSPKQDEEIILDTKTKPLNLGSFLLLSGVSVFFIFLILIPFSALQSGKYVRFFIESDSSLTPQKLKLLNFKGLKGSFLGVPLQLTIYGNYLASSVLVQEPEAPLP